jgi:hypothetical protein
MLDWRNQQQSATPIFHPTNPNVVYTLPFQNSGDRLEISTDKGLTWSLVGGSNPVWKGDNLLSFTIDRGNPSLCLLAGQNGLYRSTTGGTTWAKVSGAPGGLIGLSVDQTSPIASRVVLASTSSAPWRSDDGGLTWAQKSSGLPAGATIRAFSAGSDPAPAVVGGAVNGGDVQRSQITSVAFQFSENVSAAVTVGDLTLRNDTAGTAVNLSGLTAADLTWDAATNRAVWSLAKLNLSDGNYTATLPAASVTDWSGSALTGAGTVGFHRLLCDANGDRKVDGGDLALWQQNYDPLKVHQDTPGMGDWNGDGKIDGGDLALWQQHYNAIGLSAEGPAQPLMMAAEARGVATPASDVAQPPPAVIPSEEKAPAGAAGPHRLHADKVIGRHAKPADVHPAEPAVTLDSLLQPIRLRDSGCPRH